MTANLAVFGTGSEVGKSTMVSALCRLLHRRGTDVAPFKAQNMSNNSGVTPTGDEIGRAQIVQAEAANVPPHADMNPILLKPSGEKGSQLVKRGQATSHYRAQQYYEKADELMDVALESYDRLTDRFEAILIEGAGSCAEVNLKHRDFANFRLANAVDAPVVLVADIDRGGVFAQVVGTLELLEPSERERVKGVIVNRFRGDQSLFEEGRAFLEDRTGVPVFGVVTFNEDLDLPSEDSLSLQGRTDERTSGADAAVRVGVIRLPHISNFTDFDPLERDPLFTLDVLKEDRVLDDYDAVILPGTKNVRSDLDWLHSSGWADRIATFHDRGGQVIGICGGYQMLGRVVRDPDGVEGTAGATEGLNLLPVETKLASEKQVYHVTGKWGGSEVSLTGYEIHMGETQRLEDVSAALCITSRNGREVSIKDGARVEDGSVWGCYLHGLFEEPGFRRWLIQDFGGDVPSSKREDVRSGPAYRDQQYERLADHVERHLDLELLEEQTGLIAGGGR